MADNHLAMSDEDFLNQAPPGTEGPSSDEPQKDPAAATDPAVVEEPIKDEPQPQGDPAKSDNPDGDPTPEDEGNPKPEDTPAKEEPKADEPAGKAEPDDTGSEPKPQAEAGAGDGKQPETKAPNYEEFYQQVMKPFTANGKKIELKDPAEAIQLMQMGANYTRKMQELAPHRKLLTMLGNNELLDEDKLSFLIDLDKKDPEAIKRLIKDSGIDPLDIDTNTEPAYREGSHKVSDAEQAFQSQLEEVSSSPVGQETLTVIDKTWDQTSKDMLWQHPEVMSVITQQRELGIYDKITAEIDRQKTLGTMPPETPFLEGYRIAGDALYNAGALGAPGKTESGNGSSGATQEADNQPGKVDPTPIATRTAAPKSDVAASDKVGAAAPTRTAPGKAKEAVNFLAMSDEDFLKAEPFRGRV